jgi:hypothetical protein
MAESPNNGMVHLSLKDRALSVTGKDVVMIIFVLVIGSMAYLRTKTLDAALADLKIGQTSFVATLHEQIARQNDLLAHQTIQLQADMEKQNDLLSINNGIIQRMLRTHEYNQYQPPEGKIPLDMPLDDLRKK